MSNHHDAVNTAPPAGHIRIIGFTVAALAIVSDLVTKWWALTELSDGNRIPILGDFFSLRLIRNSGAAFSLGNNATLVLTAVAIVVSVALAVGIWKARNVTISLALGGLLGGALGNVYDRFFSEPYYGRGHVVDFIDYNGYFVGNVADIWIVLAALTLIVLTFREEFSHA